MREVLIKSIKRHLLLLLLLLGIPSLTYWGLFYSAGLPPITYVINSMAGFLTIVFLVWFEYKNKIRSRILSVIVGMVVISLAMFVVFYTFDFVSPVQLTPLHLAEAGFSFIFGVCVAISFRLMIFKEKKEDWSETMRNIKERSKDLFRSYGNYFVLISIVSGIGFLIFSQFARGWLTIGFALISVGIAFISIKIAIDSGDRMTTIGDGEIKQSLINIQEIRKEYTYGLDEYLHTPKKNKKPQGKILQCKKCKHEWIYGGKKIKGFISCPACRNSNVDIIKHQVVEINIQRLQRINIFTTWLQFENIQKMIIFKDYMTPQQTSRLFGYHRTLIDFVLPNWKDKIVSNESVIQLLSGITKLYENFEEPNNFHEKFYVLLRQFIGQTQQDEEFLDYINRKKQELKVRGMYNLFRRFQ